jgi:hypothetical protein
MTTTHRLPVSQLRREPSRLEPYTQTTHLTPRSKSPHLKSPLLRNSSTQNHSSSQVGKEAKKPKPTNQSSHNRREKKRVIPNVKVKNHDTKGTRARAHMESDRRNSNARLCNKSSYKKQGGSQFKDHTKRRQKFEGSPEIIISAVASSSDD